MLFLCFKVGKETYGIRASEIIEVIPLIPLEKVPGSETSIAGIFNYRGNPLPVIDLCQYFHQHPCQQLLSSRIIIIRQQHAGTYFDVGLIAENVTETLQANETEFHASGLKNSQDDFLGEIMHQQNKLIQIINTDRLIPPSMRLAIEQTRKKKA